MRRVSLDDLAGRSPLGCYVVSNDWLGWCWDATLCGSLFWGRPTETEMIAFLAFSDRLLVRAGAASMAARFDVITDATRLEGVDPLAFTALATHTAGQLATLVERVRCHAILPPPGMAGAAVAGLYPLLQAGPASWKVTPNLDAAVQLVASAAARAAQPELERLAAELGARPAVVRALHDYLAANLSSASLERAARALAVATRSLQRQLTTAGTSFRGELERARIDEARRKLADSDDKLESIADELGFSSATHFGARFRAVTGELPSDYRSRCRAR